jgi:uncharacterized protein
MTKHALIQEIRAQFALDWRGIHGSTHWARVRANGLLLAKSTGADVEVIEYFSLLHDAKRQSDGADPNHGPRAAEWAQDLRGRSIDLEDAQFEMLTDACRYHTSGRTDGEITVQTCWDADRLDLGRVGILPDPRRLCTDAARDKKIIRWAYERSRGESQ